MKFPEQINVISNKSFFYACCSFSSFIFKMLFHLFYKLSGKCCISCHIKINCTSKIKFNSTQWICSLVLITQATLVAMKKLSDTNNAASLRSIPRKLSLQLSSINSLNRSIKNLLWKNYRHHLASLEISLIAN